MNPRQKHYDSFNKTNKLLKLTNSFYHYRNLEKIKNRSPRYTIKPLSLSPNKKIRQFNIFQAYDIEKQNNNIKNKIKKNFSKTSKTKYK